METSLRGFGLAIQKPIILLHSSSRSVTPMITGLGSLYSKAVNPVSGMAPALEIISFDGREDKLAQLSQALERFVQIVEPVRDGG